MSETQGPSWQNDPTSKHQLRYWDGKEWTDQVSDKGMQSTDPINNATDNTSIMQTSEQPAVATKFYKSNWFIILTLVLCFPIGLIFMWMYAKKWNLVVKIIVTIVVLGLFAFGALQPKPVDTPKISVKNDSITTEKSSYNLKVTVKDPDDDVEVTIDGDVASKNGDEFSKVVKLDEGDNDIEVVATRKSKTAVKNVSIYRLSDEEIAEKEAKEEAAKEKAAEAKLAKEKAALDKAAAAQEAKDKVATDKAAKEQAAKDKKAAEEAAKNAPKTSFGDGTFLVNKEIEPGTYKTSGSGACYWERLSGTSGEFGDIISNGFETSQTLVTIKSSDYVFKSQSCGTWTKI